MDEWVNERVCRWMDGWMSGCWATLADFWTEEGREDGNGEGEDWEELKLEAEEGGAEKE